MYRVIPLLFMFGAAIFGAMYHIAQEQRACEAAGGHYVTQPFTSNECWALDGTHRIFP